MRIWDLSPGYLNRFSLLGEHRELHGLHSILVNGRRGYSSHPETLRWVGARSGLVMRHALLAAEMRLRRYHDKTPLARTGVTRWPRVFVTEPYDQIVLLQAKYAGIAKGRIVLPRSAPQLWAQHKYSVMARDPNEYRRIGRQVARYATTDAMRGLARDLVMLTRERPSRSRAANAIEHMWGYVRPHADRDEAAAARRSASAMLRATQEIAVRVREPYLLASTALGELSLFV